MFFEADQLILVPIRGETGPVSHLCVLSPRVSRSELVPIKTSIKALCGELEQHEEGTNPPEMQGGGDAAVVTTAGMLD